MLLTLLPLAGFAQRNVGDKFPADAFVYEVLAAMEGDEPGEVALIGIRDGYVAPTPEKALIQDGALVIPNQMSADLFGEVYTFNVVELGVTAAQAAADPRLTAYANPLQTRLDASGLAKGSFTGTADAKTVVFPAHIKEIPSNCFNGYTNVKSITFAVGSELETINDFAFATTQITKFDFSPCSQLAALPNQVFVEDGKINSYITEITLPENSKLLKDIQGAFKHLPSLKRIVNLEKSSITQVIAEAFDGDAALTKVELPGTVQTIAAGAFANCGVKELIINVGSLLTAGNGIDAVYGANVTKLEKLTLTGNLGGIIKTNAFKGSTSLATLDLSGLNFASLGQIATSAFEGCTKIEAVTIGNILDQPAAGATIAADAFKDCSKLATVTVGDINSANAIGAGAFGNKLKTVKIGRVKAGAASILTNAFVFANVKGASLVVATEAEQYLSCDEPGEPLKPSNGKEIIKADAFNFDAIDGTLDSWVDQKDAAVVTFGEIRSKGGVFEAGAVSGNHIRMITFAGNIAQGGLDAQIYDNTANASSLWTITFSGNLEQNAIEANAFANLAAKPVTLTFAGSLAKEAVMAGAFEGLLGKADPEKASKLILDYTPADATVNPFQKGAFQATAVVGTTRDIFMTVTEKGAELLAKFKSTTKGLRTDGAFDIYRVDFYVPAPTPDNSFTVYQNANETNVAWARIKFSADKLSGTLNGGDSDLKIQRYQKVKDGEDEVDAKLTLYGTYTDEDNAEKVSTIYMVPLKVTDGFYHIAKTDAEIIIAKVTKAAGNFTNTDIKVPVLTAGYAAGSESLWTGLHNSELFIAKNVMTNQQLVDKTAKDGLMDVDIYRGETTIQEDLYVMTDPAKYKGFSISKITIAKATDGKGAYIGEGWYYMLLQKYGDAAPAPAHVVWLDADPETDPNTTGIFEMKQSVNEKTASRSNATYNLAGQKVGADYKGIVIKNGKKYVVK